MKKLFKREFWIGLSVLITLVVLFFGINYLKGVNIFHTANYYFVTYNDVQGLTQSAPVTVNGFKVGLVREIKYQYDNPGHISVELSLDNELKIPKGTRAMIVCDMLGTASIELIMGTGPDFYNAGDELPGALSPGMLQAISEKVMPVMDETLPRVNNLLDTVTRLAGNPALNSSIYRLDNVLAGLETSVSTLNHAMVPMPAIMNNVNNTMGNASQAMVDVKQMAANLNRVSEDLAELSKVLKNAPVDSTLRNINETSRSLAQLANQLNDPNSSLGLLMHDPALYNNINNLAAQLDSILIDVKKSPKRYIPAIKLF